MTFIDNIKVRGKLFLGFAVILIALIAVAILGVVDVRSVNNSYSNVLTYNVRRYSILQEISTSLMDIRRVVALGALQSGEHPGLGDLQRESNEAHTNVTRLLDEYMVILNNSPNMETSERMESESRAHALRREIDTYMNRVPRVVFANAAIGPAQRANSVAYIIEGFNMMDDIYSIYMQMMDEYQRYMRDIVDIMDSRADVTTWLLIGASAGAVLLGIIIALFISHAITRPVRDMVVAMDDVAKGNFNVNLELDRKDEFGVLDRSMSSLITTIKSVTASIDEIIVAAGQKGDLEYHIDTRGYQNAWLAVLEDLNRLCEIIDEPVVEVRNVMANLSNGDFSKKIAGDYKGDFLTIKNGVNGTIDSLSGYISEMSGILSSIADGDLTQGISREYLGSFSEIKRSINHIAASLNTTMQEIAASTEQVLAGAKQISQSSMDLANGAQSQASSVEELNASIDLINHQTRANAENTATAKVLSSKSSANATDGNAAMKQMLDAMTAIRESSSSISRINSVIQEISFQTNLLSLNAAVEAARAGDHGRGFGVVAEEVRSLATRSQVAAGETTELIQDSIARVEEGSTIAKSTASSLETIVTNANDVMELISSISNSSTEQAEAVNQISIGLQQISTIVQSNAAVSEETAAAAEELNAQADVLQQLVSHFKL